MTALRVPYVALVEQHAPLKERLLEAVARVLDKGDFILGEAVASFEARMAERCGTRFAVGVNSGTDALFLTLKACGVGPGDEVITAPNSFLASASAIAAAGARPVFVDIREDLNIDPEKIEAALTPRTKALVPVHLTGKPADMDTIVRLARERGLRVIEDAAQSIGAEYHGIAVGALGDAGCFSLHPLKTLNACGDAGVITTDDEALRDALVQLRNIGLKNRDESDFWGYNSRLDSIHAAMLLVKLDHLDGWTEARRRNAAFYGERLAEFVTVPREEPATRSVFHTYVIQTDAREALKAHLEKNGVGSAVHYPIPIHLQKAAAELGYGKGSFPVCERAVERILSLPVHQGLGKEELEHVAAAVASFFKGGGR